MGIGIDQILLRHHNHDPVLSINRRITTIARIARQASGRKVGKPRHLLCSIAYDKIRVNMGMDHWKGCEWINMGSDGVFVRVKLKEGQLGLAETHTGIIPELTVYQIPGCIEVEREWVVWANTRRSIKCWLAITIPRIPCPLQKTDLFWAMELAPQMGVNIRAHDKNGSWRLEEYGKRQMMWEPRLQYNTQARELPYLAYASCPR
ncbi:hypothetical protein B0J17DRAFT_711036 [Rhizoctonia solani]|nr:hypothetical protein B0J17DRAFT_711036 [Rhizoctonia solani]